MCDICRKKSKLFTQALMRLLCGEVFFKCRICCRKLNKYWKAEYTVVLTEANCQYDENVSK